MRAQLKWLVKPALTMSSTAVLFACAAGGTQQFQAGHAAYAGGDLAEAYEQYAAAVDADPSNEAFEAARVKVAAELAEKTAAEARALADGGQWREASQAWARAADLAPGEARYAVRRDLSEARADEPDQTEWFEAAKRVADRYPGEAYAEQTLTTAREKAYQYHVGLAEDLLAAGRGQEALRNFEVAREVDPDTPGLRVDLVTKAEALALSEEADLLASQGEHIAAYEKYQAAYAKLALPEIKTKRDRSKAKAGRILALLEQARSQNKRGRLGQAVALYEKALKLGGVPASVEQEVAQARAALVARDAEVATRYANKGSLRSASRAVERGLRHAEVDDEVAGKVRAGLLSARKSQPARALEAFDGSGLAADSPLYDACQAVALASARAVLARATRYSKRKRTEPRALALLGDIEVFEDDLPQIAELRRSLRAGSYLALIDEAERAAKRKRDGEAASLLMAALDASSGPDDIRDAIKTGTDALKVGRFADAEKAFRDALVKAPRSKLAQAATGLTRARRAQAEREAVALLESGRGNDLEATDLLEAGLELDPSSEIAKAGVTALMARLRRPGLSDAQAGALIGFANRLGATPGAARPDVAEGAARLAEGDLLGASKSFGEALDQAPGNALAELGQSMAKSRALASLKGEAKAATSGDAVAAEALAQLLEKNPNDPDARRQLRALLDKARMFAARQDDAEAARFLALAATAERPGPQLKAALDKGHAALKAGNVVAAERAYAQARSIDANNRAAKTGHEIAKGARTGALKGALTAARAGGDLELLEMQLSTTLAADPDGPEAKEALDAVIAEAKQQASKGNVARAAMLLDSAVVAEPAERRPALETANAALKAGDFKRATAGYAKVGPAGSVVAAAGLEIAESGASSNLAAAVKGLETGDDLERGAAAARALLEADPTNARARRAVRAGLMRAERAAAEGDDAGAARNLKAVAAALGTSARMDPAIDMLARGKYAEAEEAFSAVEGAEVGRAGARIARSRKLFSLKAGLSGAGTSAALSIRRLMQADPNNAEAKKAFDDLLAKAVKAAAAGDDVEAADTLNQASVAAASPRDLDSAIKGATAQLKEGRYALAEIGFSSARDINADSKVVKTGLKVARDSRARYEATALEALRTGRDDPRPYAKGLAASLKVDPKSRAVAQAVDILLARAARSAKAANDTDLAQSLEAASILENKSAEQLQRIAEASAKLAQGAFADARKTLLLANADKEGAAISAVAAKGAELAKDRRLAILKDRFAEAGEAKDILRQADIVQQILEVEPRDRMASRAKARLVVSVQKERLAAARTQKAQGKLGVAHLYLVRSLALDAKDRAARAELADIEDKLKKSMDLIIVVEPVQRDTRLGTSKCRGFDGVLREELQTTLSKEANLGTYVLSPAWTALYEKKDQRAPNVNGGLRIRLDECRIDPGSGEVSYTWDILTPRRGGTVAEGEATTTLPMGLVLKDEQDAAGKNAAKKLADRVAKDLIAKLEEARPEISQWLVSRAEHGMAIEDPVMVAEAYARIRQMNPRRLDPDRIMPIEAYLAKAFR